MMIIVMGVAGCGKSSVGQTLAARLGWPMLEGDAFHPQANKDKMASGTPLSDEDRWPWLDEIAAEMRRRDNAAENAIVACSALKRVYRDRLRKGAADVRFVHLTGSRAVHEDRIRSRTGHFMPASMLDSQLATLEPPTADEAALAVDIDQPLEAMVDRVMAWLDR